MLYQGIASRVGGVGDDLARVRRVFDWMVQQIQLVPAGLARRPQHRAGTARPYDVLLRGMATEGEGNWSERGWLFCLALPPARARRRATYLHAPRGQGADPLVRRRPDRREGLPLRPPARPGDPRRRGRRRGHPRRGAERPGGARPARPERRRPAGLHDPGRGAGQPVEDRRPDRFEPPLLRAPDEAAPAEPRGQEPRRSFTATRPGSATGSPRRSGDRLGEVNLWELPITVETLLFTNSQFVAATQSALALFRPELPLVYARVKQLRGEIPEAIQSYVAFRFAENGTMMDKKTPMPAEAQAALDVYSTYFLGHVPARPEEPAAGRVLLREDPPDAPRARPAAGPTITCSAEARRPTSPG